ncbi:MAG: AraC family transcriptional regulator [Corynebacterium variabile]|uniref:helix-turn-helix domain-containing protein n=1 Tax=Corynebacterium variabile TaxID=1727 RepID=UPI002647E4A7|nr:AraC family transcriptional regulator [Corynebacterium variabile]MDN6478004.1 AraC family transcriptional regulator [Corynebacterium variabile]MDN6619511.1 AraC family transcriptional regulator [Corynebacterium variabile]MDN6844575.1 AraC family transcriptional regulator [Corynebacterium variabile]
MRRIPTAPGCCAGSPRSTEEFRRHPDIDRNLTDWADRLDCTIGDLTDALGLVGTDSVRRWASTVRMTMARHLLASGIPVGAAARHLGYSGTASFSHVFRRAHGVSPRAWHGYV